MKPTAAEIAAAQTPAGGWTRDTLAQWGVPWPPPKGWRAELEMACKACGKPICDHKDAVYQGVVPAEGV